MSRRRKILIVSGIALVIAALIPVVRHCRLRAATEAYIAELKAQGEPMELSQVVPPPVPPEKNAVALITNALAQIDLEHNYTNSLIFLNSPYAMSRTIPGKEMIGWNQPVIHDPGGDYPTNTWNDLRAQLAARQSDLDDLRRLIENPAIDFDYDYSDPKAYVPVLAPRLGQFKEAAQWLRASEFYNLHKNRSADACTDVRAILAFVKGQTDERFEISQLVRFAIAGMAASATWDILQTTNVSGEGLMALQQDWESLKFTSPLAKAFLFERVSAIQLQDNLRQTPINLDTQVAWTRDVTMTLRDGTRVSDEEKSLFRRVQSTISGKWHRFQWRWFSSFSDEHRGLQMWQAVIDGTQMLDTNNSFPSVQSFLNANFSRLGFDAVKKDPYAILSQNAGSQIAAIRKAARAEVARNIVVTAIALKRCELRRHQLPASLDELVPEFLQAVPTDFMAGRPLRYRRNADGTFLLYSVGENGKDDGGNPALEAGVTGSTYHWQSPHALDWVWPQPATREEVQNYYEHPPK